MSRACLQCAKELSHTAENRLPPWCPHCGADVKPLAAVAELAPSPEHASGPAPASPASTVERRWSRVRAAEAPGWPQEPLRFQLDWSEPAGFRRCTQPALSRLPWLPRILFILLALSALGVLALWLFGELLPELAVKVSLSLGIFVLCLIAIPLLIWLAKTITPYQIELGPHGVSCFQAIAAGQDTLVEGWTLPWDHIEGLLYVEDVPLEGRAWRALVVRTRDGRQEVLGVADSVTRAQLGEAAGERFGSGLGARRGGLALKGHRREAPPGFPRFSSTQSMTPKAIRDYSGSQADGGHSRRTVCKPSYSSRTVCKTVLRLYALRKGNRSNSPSRRVRVLHRRVRDRGQYFTVASPPPTFSATRPLCPSGPG